MIELWDKADIDALVPTEFAKCVVNRVTDEATAHFEIHAVADAVLHRYRALDGLTGYVFQDNAEKDRRNMRQAFIDKVLCRFLPWRDINCTIDFVDHAVTLREFSLDDRKTGYVVFEIDQLTAMARFTNDEVVVVQAIATRDRNGITYESVE